ncbi:hypothetical protein FOZ62_030530, partial [Perkinsus olseni]
MGLRSVSDRHLFRSDTSFASSFRGGAKRLKGISIDPFRSLLAKVLNLPEMPVYPLTAEEAAAIYGRHLADDDEDKCGDHGQLEAGGICECDANWYHIQIDDGSVMWCAYNNRETPDI